MNDCLFCKIASGEVSCHKIWEDENHLAFLSVYPNTEGVSVVITKNIMIVMHMHFPMKY